MTKDEALAFDLALEALESCTPADTSTGHVVWPSYDEQAVKQAITAIKQVRALDKMAENARELGLDYEPVAPVQEDWGPGPHECHSLTAAPVQERFELIGHADLGINNIYIFNGYGEEVPEGRTPLYASYTTPPAAPVQDELAYRAAVSLATWLFKKHFAHEEHYASGRVVWEPCDTTAGVISQIDNMVCGLVQPAATVKESLTVQPAAPVQEPVAWRYRGIFHEFDPSDWAEGPVTPLYTTPPAQPAPVQEPVAFFDPQGKGFYWAKPTKITAPVTVDVEPLPLYTTQPAAQRQWVGLTDEQINTFFEGMEPNNGFWLSFARAIEAKLKEKNT